VILAIQIVLLVFWVAANQNHFSLLQFKTVRFRSYPAKLEFITKLAKKGDWFVRISGLVVLVGAGALVFGLSRAYTAYYYMYRSNQALATSNAVQVYENQRLAVLANPYLDTLRRDYALTNLQLAIALSNNADITEQERQQVTQLISQAVREGRAATLLDPGDVDNWLVLAEVYRNLIGAADEAGNWAVNSLVSASQVNPVNPFIRLQLGQLALADAPQDAARFFSQAIELKPNLPASHYQLGLALQQLGQLENARVAWQQALQLLPETSDDYLTLSQQLEELEELILQQEISAEAETEGENTAPNVTEQNVSQQESDVVRPGEDAQLGN
jgi:tetratricopeptide (TPR) repeat protein